jgi:putative restriction endonuclease
MTTDYEIRLAAFDWLNQQEAVFGDVLSRSLLEKGFEYHQQIITLIGPKGIWKPKIMEFPLSITTVLDGPYDDSFPKDGFLKYKYRGTDPYHADNIGLREIMKRKLPLIYFFALEKGRYLVTKPVYIIGDHINELYFNVVLDDEAMLGKTAKELELVEEDTATYGRRAYITSNMKVRLHQRSFRERVLRAYNNQCSLCRLKHIELLDAAHIMPDKEEEGLPLVTNGLSLCKIHHSAFDTYIIGITPDYKIKVRHDILHETDGPMLKYGIQSLEGQKIILPASSKNWPDREKLEYRYGMFLER